MRHSRHSTPEHFLFQRGCYANFINGVFHAKAEVEDIFQFFAEIVIRNRNRIGSSLRKEPKEVIDMFKRRYLLQ